MRSNVVHKEGEEDGEVISPLSSLWHIAKGQLINPTSGATRTEEDFKNHIAQTLDTDPEAGWIFIVDQLNIHQSESRRASGSRTLRD